MKNIFTENIDKYGIVNLIIWVSIPIALALMIYGRNGLTTSVSSSSNDSNSNSTSFTNKYGTATTKCVHSGCNNYIASTGDTNCCEIHSNKCKNCNKYIDGDALYCMDCMEGALKKKLEYDIKRNNNN